MTMEEILSKLKEQFPDEIHDSNSYFDMAKVMSNCENPDKLAIKHLYAMSKDEYTHAEAIKDILIDNGVYIPTEQLTMFDELQERIYRKFR